MDSQVKLVLLAAGSVTFGLFVFILGSLLRLGIKKINRDIEAGENIHFRSGRVDHGEPQA